MHRRVLLAAAALAVHATPARPLAAQGASHDGVSHGIAHDAPSGASHDGARRAAPLRRVVVAVRPLARGAVVAEGDVTLRDTALALRAPLLDDATRAHGAVLRRVVQPGEPLRAADLAPAVAVRGGDTVTAELVRDGVRLTLRATALRHAALGAPVTLRTLADGRRLTGTVVSRALVRLD